MEVFKTKKILKNIFLKFCVMTCVNVTDSKIKINNLISDWFLKFMLSYEQLSLKIKRNCRYKINGKNFDSKTFSNVCKIFMSDDI